MRSTLCLSLSLSPSLTHTHTHSHAHTHSHIQIPWKKALNILSVSQHEARQAHILKESAPYCFFVKSMYADLLTSTTLYY